MSQTYIGWWAECSDPVIARVQHGVGRGGGGVILIYERYGYTSIIFVSLGYSGTDTLSCGRDLVSGARDTK